MVRAGLHAPQKRDAAVERWLHEEVVPVYDAMAADSGCALGAGVGGEALAAHCGRGGTVSGFDEGERGCLLEITEGGSRPIELPGGERRGLLEDGDEVVLSGRCVRESSVPIGLGECRGIVSSAAQDPGTG
jgi:hypothetical protein